MTRNLVTVLCRLWSVTRQANEPADSMLESRANTKVFKNNITRKLIILVAEPGKHLGVRDEGPITTMGYQSLLSTLSAIASSAVCGEDPTLTLYPGGGDPHRSPST